MKRTIAHIDVDLDDYVTPSGAPRPSGSVVPLPLTPAETKVHFHGRLATDEEAVLDDLIGPSAFEQEADRLDDLLASGLRDDEYKFARNQLHSPEYSPLGARPAGTYHSSEPPMPSSSLVDQSKLKSAGWERLPATVSDPPFHPDFQRRLAKFELDEMSRASHMTALEIKLAEIQSFIESKFVVVEKVLRDMDSRIRSLESESMMRPDQPPVKEKIYDEAAAERAAIAQSLAEANANCMDLDE